MLLSRVPRRSRRAVEDEPNRTTSFERMPAVDRPRIEMARVEPTSPRRRRKYTKNPPPTYAPGTNTRQHIAIFFIPRPRHGY